MAYCPEKRGSGGSPQKFFEKSLQVLQNILQWHQEAKNIFRRESFYGTCNIIYFKGLK